MKLVDLSKISLYERRLFCPISDPDTNVLATVIMRDIDISSNYSIPRTRLVQIRYSLLILDDVL